MPPNCYKYVANSNFFNDWISTTECVGTDDDMIYKYVLGTKDSYKYFVVSPLNSLE